MLGKISALERHILPVLGTLRLDAITTLHIEDYKYVFSTLAGQPLNGDRCEKPLTGRESVATEWQ